MAKRNDIHGDPKAPDKYTQALTRIGGKNPFGEPNYRLVHTANRMQMQGGAWKEWDEGLSVAQRGGMVMHETLGIMVPSEYKPNKVVIEMRWVKKYINDGFEGWLLERWMPASWYGSQDVWNRLTLPNHPDIQLLGPYPTEGDYECCSSIETELPSLESLQECIQFQNHCEENRLRGSLEDIVMSRVADAASAYDAEMEKNAAETEYRVKEMLSPWTSTSLEAGRWRQAMADRAGVKEHAGN